MPPTWRTKSAKALKALAANQPALWKALRAQGIFRGHGPAPKVAFLYTGQGSQYVNMLRPLRAAEPIVAQTFAEADRVMTPLLGKPLSEFIFVDQADANAVAKAEEDLRQTAITQPAVLAIDLAMTRLLAAYGIQPDMTMGHSLGEYGALVASGALPFAGRAGSRQRPRPRNDRVAMADNGRMAAVFAPLAEIERILKTIDGYVVIANINSNTQAVIGGASKAVEQAMEAFLKAGYNAVPLAGQPRLPHLDCGAGQRAAAAGAGAPASGIAAHPHRRQRERRVLSHRARTSCPRCWTFSRGRSLLPCSSSRACARCTTPARACSWKWARRRRCRDLPRMCSATAAMWSRSSPIIRNSVISRPSTRRCAASMRRDWARARLVEPATQALEKTIQPSAPSASLPLTGDRYAELGHMFADVLDRGWQVYHGQNAPTTGLPVTITGAALGLPGTERIFDDSNVARILRGDQFIDVIPTRFRRAMLDKTHHAPGEERQRRAHLRDPP